MAKQLPLRSKILKDSARLMDCTLNIAGVCNYNPETVVLAHLNFDGGKMGGKSPEHSACFACSACHSYLDQNKLSDTDKIFYSARAMVRTHSIWFNPYGFKSNNKNYVISIKPE